MELWAPPTINPITKVAVVIILATTAFMGPGHPALYLCLAAADRLHFPRPLSIVLGVSLRFLPTIVDETFHISMSLRTRDLKPGFIGFPRKPFRSMYLHLIPLLSRSLIVADELSAAAETRGLERPGKRTHVRASVSSLKDLILIIGFILFAIIITRLPLYRRPLYA